jgi:hypothetical protein
VVLLFVTAGRADAQTPQQLFQQANLLYQQGKMTEARDAYASILHAGYVSGELYYNLGNTYYKTGDIAHAILWYERARRLMPQDDDLQHNLQLANLLIVDRIDPTPRLFVWDYWDGLKNAFSLTGITWWVYGAFLLAIGVSCLVVLARSYRWRKAGFIVGAAATTVFVFLLVVMIAKVSDLRRTDFAIVTTSIASIKNSPDPKSSDAFVLHGGVKVQITDAVSEWVKIRLADGKVGWMEKDAAEVI